MKNVFKKYREKVDPIIKKRVLSNVLVLIIGTVLLFAFLAMLQYRAAILEQQTDSQAVLSGIQDALNQNVEEIETLTEQYHETNYAKLRNARRILRSVNGQSIMKLDETQRKEVVYRTWDALDTLFFVVDEDGNIVIVPNGYYESFSNLYQGEWNIFSMNLIGEGDFASLINSEKPVKVKLEDGYHYYYCLALSAKSESGKPLYLLSGTSAEMLEEEISSLTSFERTLGNVTIGTSGFAFATDSKSGEILYFDDGKVNLSGEKASEHYITEEMLRDGFAGFRTIDNHLYYCVSLAYPDSAFGSNVVITVAQRMDNVMRERIKVILYALFTFLSVALFLIIYAYMLQTETGSKSYYDDLKPIFTFRKKPYYINKRIAKVIVPIAVLGVVIIFAVSMYSQTLIALSKGITQSIASHTEIEKKLSVNEEIKDKMTSYYEEQYLIKAKTVARMLEENPNFAFKKNDDEDTVHPIIIERNGQHVEKRDTYGNVIYSNAFSEKLQEICDDNGFNTIYLFDSEGYTRATNNSDWYFVLSDNPEDQSYSLWNVIEGKDDAQVQELQRSDNGEMMQFIGVKFYYYTYCDEDGSTAYASKYKYDMQSESNYDGPAIKKNHGMLEVGISAEQVAKMLEITSYQYMFSKMYVMNEGHIIAFDSDENHTILYAPNKNKIDNSAAEMGFETADFAESYNGFKNMGNQDYFVILREDNIALKSNASDEDKNTCFIATAIPTNQMYTERNIVSLITLLAGVLVIIALILFTIVMNKEEWEVCHKLVLDFNKNVYRTKSERLMTNANIKHRSPEQRLEALLKGFLVVLVVILWIYITFIYSSASGLTLLEYIFSFNWNKTFNVISVTAVLVIFTTVLVVVDSIFYLVMTIAKNLGVRSTTISHLVMACLKSVIIAFTIFYCLYLIGLDARSLLAGAGILSVVLGFGAQHVIGDFLAGIFIVFEGSFRVGDFVKIGDFRGEVLEIGLRTTKIESEEYEVKIFNNSSISEIINLTKENSFARIIVGVEYESDLEKVERVVRGAFEGWRQKYPEIIAVPIYRGVESLSESSIDISIWAPCMEKVRPQLERSLNHEILQLFEENGIGIAYPHLVPVPYQPTNREGKKS